MKILFPIPIPRKILETLLRIKFQLQFRPSLSRIKLKKKKELQANQSWIFLGELFIYWLLEVVV